MAYFKHLKIGQLVLKPPQGGTDPSGGRRDGEIFILMKKHMEILIWRTHL